MAWTHDPDRLTIVHPDAASLPQEEFAVLRRQGLGASDASIYLGLNKWQTVDALVEQKLATGYTDEERKIAAMIQVQMGHYLEPLILKLWANEYAPMQGIIEKPKPMFALREYPYLTVNFDGVALFSIDEDAYFPVEAKYVTLGGDKYYDFDKDVNKHTVEPYGPFRKSNLQEHAEAAGKHYGIPSYYYSQIQRQMFALNAAWGHLAVLRSKDSSFHVFKVYADAWLQKQDLIKGYQVWERILRRRELLNG